MIRYQVRSKELIDLVNEIKSRRLIMSPYFQRNLVWRLIHKVDFIKTILLGLPFPQIFIAKGSIDLETMTTTSCIVDGQQRMSTIVEFVTDKFSIDGSFFSDLLPETREEILKYQVPIIDLDINNESPEIKEIFQRLNRTFYSLNSIERLSTEYASSEFMLLAKHLTGEIDFHEHDELDDEPMPLQVDPTIPLDFIDWAKHNEVLYFNKLIVEGGVFSPYEISRQIHLMYTLNLLATHLGGYYARNELAAQYLNDYKENFDKKSEILESFERVSEFILKLEFVHGSYWFNKANMFSLFTFLSKNSELLHEENLAIFKENLINFEQNIPNEYQISAKEGVNNRKERLTRESYLKNLLFKATGSALE
jgi:hypothetical protein